LAVTTIQSQVVGVKDCVCKSVTMLSTVYCRQSLSPVTWPPTQPPPHCPPCTCAA